MTIMALINDIFYLPFLAGTDVYKALPAYTNTEICVRTKRSPAYFQVLVQFHSNHIYSTFLSIFYLYSRTGLS